MNIFSLSPTEMPVPEGVYPSYAVVGILGFHITPDLPTTFTFSNRVGIWQFIKGYFKLFAFFVKPYNFHLTTLFYYKKPVNNSLKHDARARQF